MHLVIWGCGELGGRIAEGWLATGGTVVGITRSRTRHAVLRAAGVTPVVVEEAPLLSPTDHLLLALPGSKNQLETLRMLENQAVPKRAVLASSLRWYGPLRSGRVNEETPSPSPEASGDTGVLEQRFADWAGAAGVVMRLGGLWRSGRGPVSALHRRGAPPPGPPNRALALIHYDDAATATLAALRHTTPERVYVAVTPPSPTREAFYALACEQGDLATPTFTEPLDWPPAEYDVTRLRRDLLGSPAFPRWEDATKPGRE